MRIEIFWQDLTPEKQAEILAVSAKTAIMMYFPSA